MKVSLKARLTFWYGAIVALSLSAFGIFTFLAVSNEQNSNLDTSLMKVTNSLDFIIKQNIEETEKEKKETPNEKKNTDKFKIFRQDEKKRFVGPVRPLKFGQPTDIQTEGSNIWAAVYEHILL